MPRNFKKFQKVPLSLSLIFLVFSCLAFYFIYGEINNNNKISQTAEETWQTEASRRDEVQSLDKSIKMISQERMKLETHFAQSSDVVPFLDMIEQLAPQVGAQAQVSLVNLSEDHTSLVVDVQATGSFEAIYKFLTLLENSQYELEFVSMDIKKTDTGNILSGGAVSKEWSAILKIKLLSFVQ